MFDIAPSEFLLVAFVALVVIGPKDLPKAMRVVGYWVGRARAVGRQFRSGFDEMVREAELEEMEKKWKAENERIMREHPAAPPPPADTETPGHQWVEAPRAVEEEPQRALPLGDGQPGTDEMKTDEAGDEQKPVMVEKPQVAPAADARGPLGSDAATTGKAPS